MSADTSTRPPLTPSQRKWSRRVWLLVLLVFLVFELSGAFWKRCPWRTLSETSWDLEADHPYRAVALLGFLLGLAVHIRQRKRFGRAELGGILIALIAKKLWGD